MPLAKLSFFCIHYNLFLENESQINKNNYGMMLFISKQVSLPKTSSIQQKIRPRSSFLLFFLGRRRSFLKTRDPQCTGCKRLRNYMINIGLPTNSSGLYGSVCTNYPSGEVALSPRYGEKCLKYVFSPLLWPNLRIFF